jgi:ribonuclease E
MTTREPAPADATPADATPADATPADATPADAEGDDRLEAVGERIEEARRAADDVADLTNLSEDERRAGADSAGEPTPGDEYTPG